MRCCSARRRTGAATFWRSPECLSEEISADYSDMAYAGGTQGIEARRNSFIRKWPLKCSAIAGSLKEPETGASPFTQLPDSGGARG